MIQIPIKKESSWTNWAGNHSCSPQQFYAPETEEQLQEIVRNTSQSGKSIRVIGSGHSFTGIATSDDVLISLENYNKVLKVDHESRQVTVQAGIHLYDLYPRLKSEGLSLPNFGIINKQTISGVISTGTHGSSLIHKSISSAAVAFRVIDVNGDAKEINEENPEIDAYRVSLGLLGVISTVTIQCEPLFLLRAHEHPMDWDECLERFDELSQSHEYFKVWWFPHTGKVNVFKIDRVEEIGEDQYSEEQRKLDADIDRITKPWFIDSLKNPEIIPTINKNGLDQFFSEKVRYGSSFDILVHDETVPMVVSEHSVDYDGESGGGKNYVSLLKEFSETLDGRNQYLHFPVDLRFTNKESSWLSPAFERRSFYIGMCVREYREKNVPEVMNTFWEVIKKYAARPHWGKMHGYSKEDLIKAYPKFTSFLELKQKVDPDWVFGNEYLKTLFG